MSRRLDAMRRLGRDWSCPTEPLFIVDYLSGRLPDCIDCGKLIAWHPDFQKPPHICGRCDDARMLAANNRDYDIVLVEEEYGYQYWAWYPDPPGMSHGELQALWSTIPHFYCTDYLPDKLGGEWYHLSPDGFRAEHDSQIEYGRLQYAHVHEDGDSVLILGWGEKLRRVFHAGFRAR